MAQLRNPLGRYEYTSTHREALEQWPIGSNPDKYQAATAAVVAFQSNGFDACSFGSFACKLYGVNCKPHDVDMIVLNTALSQEKHKELLVRTDPRFYLMPSRKPGATYRVLWYATVRGARVKVDVLQPGIMFIPNFAPGNINWIYKRAANRSLPVAPFDILLLLKLQGWDDHKQSDVPRDYEKHYADVEHIHDLLDIGVDSEPFYLGNLPNDFVQQAQERVYSFVREYPDTKDDWLALGFRVTRPSGRRRRRA